MSTTTIRLPEDLKARITSAAERAGKTTHSFILEAIAEKAELEEQRADFDTEADMRFAKIVASGETIPWADMRQYLEDHAAGKQVPRPIAKKKRA
jgi:predicted transcriptional regulator